MAIADLEKARKRFRKTGLAFSSIPETSQLAPSQPNVRSGVS